jgi:hypothetical protein
MNPILKEPVPIIPKTINLVISVELSDIRDKIKYLQEWEAYLVNIKNRGTTRKELSLQILSPGNINTNDTEVISHGFTNNIDKIIHFIDENCIIDSDCYVRAKDLYISFTETSGSNISETRDFPKMMDHIMKNRPNIIRKRSGEGIRYIGISLKDQPLRVGRKTNDLTYNERRKNKREENKMIQMNMFVEKGWSADQYTKIVKLGCLRIVENKDGNGINVDESIKQTENAIAERIYKRYQKFNDTAKHSQYIIEAFHTAELRDKISMISEYMGDEYSLDKALQIISQIPSELKPFEEVAPIYDERLKVVPEVKIASRQLYGDLNNAKTQISNMIGLIKSEDILNNCQQMLPDSPIIESKLNILRRAKFINNEFGRLAKEWELKDA